MNASAPEPMINSAFMAAMRKSMKFPFGIPAPAPLIRLGTALIGTDSELILRGMQVVSKKAPDHGFDFHYPTLTRAFLSLLHQEA
jgi:NAD dependent epimerase/dehydratase family enzyme